MTIEDQVQTLIDSVVQDAIHDEFDDTVKPFAERISPQLLNTLATVFEAGVEVGASRALDRISRAVNAHDALLEACKAVVKYLESLERGTPEDDALSAIRRIYHKPLLDKLRPAVALAEAE